MTERMVSVPVEPTEAMLKAGLNQEREGDPGAVRDIWSAMLAAAPVREEGGAVAKACADFQEAIDYFEADVADAMAEGSERADFWAREITVNIDALKTVMSAALRAQPPAREDGGDRPIEASWTDGVTHAYVNLSAALSAERQAWRQKLGLRIASVRYLDVEVPPAREDALRAAVDALETTRDRIQTWPINDHETCMCGSTIEAHDIGSGHSPVSQADYAIIKIVEEIDQALAALQAEQGAK